MKFVKLKKEFTQAACEQDPEFPQKNWRGYALVFILDKEKYLVPLRSKCNHKYCFYNRYSQKYLDYTKSFKLLNEKIIESKYSLDTSEYEFYQKNVKTIGRELERFSKNRKNINFCVDIAKINKIQEAYIV